MKTVVANFRLNFQSCSILIAALILFGCSVQNPAPNLEMKNEKSLEVNSECQFKSVFDDSIPGRISYFNYMGKMVKFEPDPDLDPDPDPDPDHFWQSIVVGCLNTNKGLIIIELDRNHPAESVAQMTLSTYLHKNNDFISKKYLNQA